MVLPILIFLVFQISRLRVTIIEYIILVRGKTISKIVLGVICPFAMTRDMLITYEYSSLHAAQQEGCRTYPPTA
jgi:hypothetical protein